MKRYVLAALAALTVVSMALAAAPGYKVLSKLKIGGAGGWDYVFIDSDAQRLYVSHTNQVEVVDMKTMMLAGKIDGTTGVHGIAVAPDLNRGFTSNGRDNSVTIFDTKTLAIISKTPVGMNPDAIIYEPMSKRVYTFNGSSKDATAIDAKTGMVVGTVPLGTKPEFSQTDGKGKIWVNLEPTHEIVEIDAAKASINKKYSIEPCEDPSGLARDPKSGYLFSVCGNRMMIVSDPAAGKVLANLLIGAGADGVAFDNGMAFASNGGDGTMTVVGEEGGKWAVLENVPTMRTGRTIGADPKTHRLFIPAAESTPGATKDGKQGRPTVTPDSFSIVVVGK